MKIAVVGANGQLGSDICEEMQSGGEEVFRIYHSDVDISEYEAIDSYLREIEPDVVVNTAAMHNVEACEKNPLAAFKVNALGARNLAIVANHMKCKLCHISTNYVFDGKKEGHYHEGDIANPINVYGNSKLAGENFIRSISKKYFILRTSGLYGKNPCRAKGGNNFVKTMLKLAQEKKDLKVVDDEILSPTYTRDLAKQIGVLCRTSNYGVYHAVSHGFCSWYEFAQEIFRLTKIKVNLSIAGPDEFPTKVPRPKNSVLANINLQRNGMDIMPQWEDGLKRYLEEIFADYAPAR